MNWKDGSLYKGEWKKGIQHGKGKMTFPDGRVKDGIFEDATFKGATHVEDKSFIDRTINISQIKATANERRPVHAPMEEARENSLSLLNQS
jgi:hypothetical protein